MPKIYCFDGYSEEGIDAITALIYGAEDQDKLIMNKKPSKVIDFNLKEDKLKFN